MDKIDSDYEQDQDELLYDDYDDNGEFDLGPRLSAPVAKLYTTAQLHTLIHEGVIDLNPPYQRDVVWPEQKQIKVLDSIWRNYYVPPVVFAVYVDENGDEVRCCVDGKQRLTSIQKFFDGQVHLCHIFPDKHWSTGKSWWYTCASSQKGKRLEVPPKWKQDFSSKTITCVEYLNLSKSLERDIFQRVQLGMPLTAAEKLQAITSPWQEWVFELEARFIQREDGLTRVINVDVGRGRDFQIIAQLVYCCDLYPEHAQPSAKNLEKWLQRTDKPDPQFQKTMKDVLTKFWHIANQPEYNHGFTRITKRVAPAEFVFTGVLLYALRDWTYEDLASAIYNMRNHIRSKYQDIRMRNDIIRDLWSFIEETADSDEVPQRTNKVASSSKKGRKSRARKNADDDDMDMDYRPKKQSKAK
ncbi:hypothetical protein BN946_scf184969.g38 [Trametes cinnabarina]|uniref:GmrSD restriction endonucleases N-terminal domain-containing protein n=1 Tax=Pycnoporus cinnabarinus TaxID=5643 RepID=A0A060ST16_PYCCI|nr:hypothetical protein BN946_scf184969.g38 [Trametes cinnabarina]